MRKHTIPRRGGRTRREERPSTPPRRSEEDADRASPVHAPADPYRRPRPKITTPHHSVHQDTVRSEMPVGTHSPATRGIASKRKRRAGRERPDDRAVTAHSESPVHQGHDAADDRGEQLKAAVTASRPVLGEPIGTPSRLHWGLHRLEAAYLGHGHHTPNTLLYLRGAHSGGILRENALDGCSSTRSTHPRRAPAPTASPRSSA